MLLIQFKDGRGSRSVGRLEANGKVRPVSGAESTYSLGLRPLRAAAASPNSSTSVCRI